MNKKPRVHYICAITWVNPKKCLADEIIELRGNRWVLWDAHDTGQYGPLKYIKTQAFHPGEILLLDENEREIGYPQRKPSKWGVDEALSKSRRAGMTYRIIKVPAATNRLLERLLTS